MKLKKITAAIISVAMTISMGGVLPAHAADTASGDVNIIASVSGAYSLVIPQTITLSRDGGGDGVGTYTGLIPVCDKGTIKSSQYVTVSVNTPTLTCEDGTTAAVSLSQPKDTWTCDEVSGDGTTANFAVSTELAQPGNWSGTATFGCEMGSSVPLISFTVCGTAYQAEEEMTWENWVDSSYNTSVANDVPFDEYIMEYNPTFTYSDDDYVSATLKYSDVKGVNHVISNVIFRRPDGEGLSISGRGFYKDDICLATRQGPMVNENSPWYIITAYGTIVLPTDRIEAGQQYSCSFID